MPYLSPENAPYDPVLEKCLQLWLNNYLFYADFKNVHKKFGMHCSNIII
jgi:adenosyl cobinamide kinase/adenosyl cobinamide phosphate guanylyltransferase